MAYFQMSFLHPGGQCGEDNVEETEKVCLHEQPHSVDGINCSAVLSKLRLVYDNLIIANAIVRNAFRNLHGVR